MLDQGKFCSTKDIFSQTMKYRLSQRESLIIPMKIDFNKRFFCEPRVFNILLLIINGLEFEWQNHTQIQLLSPYHSRL